MNINGNEYIPEALKKAMEKSYDYKGVINEGLIDINNGYKQGDQFVVIDNSGRKDTYIVGPKEDFPFALTHTGNQKGWQENPMDKVIEVLGKLYDKAKIAHVRDKALEDTLITLPVNKIFRNTPLGNSDEARSRLLEDGRIADINVSQYIKEIYKIDKDGNKIAELGAQDHS